MNIYEMYVEHWKRPGFWIRRTTWGNTIAKVSEVGELVGRAPYYGNPAVIAVVYDVDTGEVKDERFEVPAAGTYKTWRWVHPPVWSGEERFDPQAGRVRLNVPYGENRRASSIGARWSDLLDSWWLAADNEKALAKAQERGYLRPQAALVLFLGRYELRHIAKELGAKWEPKAKAWTLPEDRQDAISQLQEAGFKSILPGRESA